MKNIINYCSKTLLLLLFITSFTYSQTVSGTITGDEGEALVGASVMVKGSVTGTVTDLDGNYTVNASSGDVLSISYVGMLTQDIAIGSLNQVDITLKTDATSFSDIVVTATRQPVRKIRTTTAITTIGNEELTAMQPESIAEALVSAPGVTVENSQGRKSNYNIRGFPSGNTYVTTLLDGLPLNGFASRSAGTSEYLALDKNIERVEVVRGSGATLFGRAAGAGAVNLIQRSGGDEMSGTVSLTKFNNVMGEGHPNKGDFDFRIDYNINGPISDDIKFSLGGYFMEDSGYKEWGNKDKGSQISGNLDFDVSDNVKLRVYGIIGNNQFNNLTDTPVDLGTGKLADGWENYNTYYPTTDQLNFTSTLRTSVFAPFQFTSPILDVNGNTIIQNQAIDNREEVIGGLAGLSLDIKLSDKVSLVQKLRLSSYEWRDQNEISLTTFYNVNSNILRLNANSDGDIRDFINETRLQFAAGGDNSKHLISIGTYISRAKYDRFGGLHWYTSNVSPRPTYGWFGPPGTPPLDYYTLSATTSYQEENVVSVFAGDEMSFDKLSINVGARFDQMTGFFNNDPGTVGGVDYDPATLDKNELKFSNFSGSIGANYLLNDRTAIYGSFVRAFSLPSVGLGTPLPEKDEIVNNAELGVRFGIGDLGVDLGFFKTTIDNRIASVFDPNAAAGQTFIPRPVGKNNVTGTELLLTFAPSNIRGLLIRGSVTLQNSEYDGFQVPLDNIDHDRDETTPTIPEASIDNLFGLELVTIDAAAQRYAIDATGNRVQNTPNLIYSIVAGYNRDNFGISYDMVHYGGRFATALNLYETPDLTIANATVYYKIGLNNGAKLKLGVRVKNLFDTAGTQQLVLGGTNDSVLVQKQRTPDFDGVLGFGITQIPRRILLTVGYDF